MLDQFYNLIPYPDYWMKCVIIGLVTFISAFYYFSISTYGKWKKLNVPYVRPIPLFGNFLGVAMTVEHPIDLYRRIYYELAGHKYGGFFQMRTPYLMIRDPEIINKVLIKDFSYFPDRGIYTDFKINPILNHLFFMGGPKWKVIRSKLTPAFSSGKLKSMYEQIQKCGDELMKNIQKYLKKTDNEIEVRDILGKYSTDVIGTCIFGLKLNAINDDNSEFRKYGKIVFQPSSRIILNELMKMTAPVLYKCIKVKDFSVEATDFFYSAFHDTIKYREKNNIIRNDIVQALMQARQDLVLNESIPFDERFTETEIVANAFVMFVAGFETVSTAISFCLYELALKKHIQDRVRDEIKVEKSKHNGEINNEFLLDLIYLDMVLAETLRKYPATFALFREVAQPYQIPDESLIINKGQKIIIPTHSIHYDPRYYTDPEVFDPQRFSPEEKSKRPNGTYFPFGDGPRICIGKRFAEVEMKLALTEILSKYEVEPCEKTEIPVKYSTGSIVIMPRNGIWLRFKEIIEEL